ncbi:MAG: hypothetical protein CL769_04520 [Chloroflexi bacterium]|nr:hypothetical protein [Chloroflexota bacterium]MBK66198.1 hypothetical protein [Chloroflexota bacterium]|tara:strand:+ start:295 stop:474 length:180 start_codon:yes stop_codon:yes gene_type:complete
MNILGIGTFEFLIIFLVAFIILGPNKIKKFSKDFANIIKQFNSQKDELKELIEDEEKEK